VGKKTCPPYNCTRSKRMLSRQFLQHIVIKPENQPSVIIKVIKLELKRVKADFKLISSRFQPIKLPFQH